MFTGLVETVGSVVSVRPGGVYTVISIRAASFSGALAHGQSVAVSGACLTVSGISGEVFSVDVMPETIRKTKLRNFRPGTKVNLERALRADGRLDGHMVTGHVDGIGIVGDVSRDREGYLLTVSLDEEAASMIVPRGSIAIDGVSLTIARYSGLSCTVSLIPATLEGTALGSLGKGDEVNVETDILGKYVRRFLGGGASSPSKGTSGSLTRDAMREAGWI